MERFKNIVWYVVLNGAFAACVFYGVSGEHPGIANLTVFFVWVLFIGSVIVSLNLENEKARESVEKIAKHRSVPRWMDQALDLVLTITFIYNGWFVCGVVYCIHSLLMVATKESAKKLYAERTAEANAKPKG